MLFTFMWFLFLILICIVPILVDGAKSRQRLEVLRVAIERGQDVDPKIIDALGPHPANPKALLIAGIIVVAAAVGIAAFSPFLRVVQPEAFVLVIGAACAVLCVGSGLMIAYRFSRNP
jgi:hypothetical protein